MATIEVRCNVRLSEAIVLATQQDASYGAICWTLANGDTVALEMDIPEAEIKRSYQEHSSRGNWWVNSRVEVLRISIRLENVSADDLDRLYGRYGKRSIWFSDSSVTTMDSTGFAHSAKMRDRFKIFLTTLGPNGERAKIRGRNCWLHTL